MRRGTGIQRVVYEGRNFVKKKLRSENELELLIELNRRGFSVPKLIDIEKQQDGTTTLLLEDIGEQHLEINPGCFREANDQLVSLRKIDIATPVPPITTETIFHFLSSNLNLHNISKRLDWNESRVDALERVWKWIVDEGSFGEDTVFSHGDYHPRNILARSGRIVTIDWEYGGYHSVFQDLYALVHMCYPDRKACLTHERQRALYQAFSKRLGLPEEGNGYWTFYFLNRLQELLLISQDLDQQPDDATALFAQADMVYGELQRDFSAISRVVH